MEPDRLMASLRAGEHRGESAPAGDCPDVHWIAGYVDGALEPEVRRQVESHLADCTHCLELVALLCREREPVREAKPQARAVSEATSRPGAAARRSLRHVPAWAAAAALAVVVPLLITIGPESGLSPRRPDGPYAPTRAASGEEFGLRILSPHPGAVVGRGELEIRWSEVPGSPHYDVRIVTETGDLVAHDRVEGTGWRPPADASLRPGLACYVHVDAYPGGDKALGSEHVAFRIADEPP